VSATAERPRVALVAELHATGTGYLLRTDLQALGMPERAVDALFRKVPVVALEVCRRSRRTTSTTDGSRSMHLGGAPWARIGEHVGQRNLAVTANTHTHVLADETELDYLTLVPSRPRT
jgi:hypothetical protein